MSARFYEADGLARDRFFPGGFEQERATFKHYTIAPATNVAKVRLYCSKSGNHVVSDSRSPQIPDNITFDQAATIPLCLATAVTGLWSHHPEASSVGLVAPWEEGGMTKYVGQPALISGASSCVGQYGAYGHIVHPPYRIS